MTAPRGLFSYRPYWAQRFGIAPFLPTTRAERRSIRYFPAACSSKKLNIADID